MTDTPKKRTAQRLTHADIIHAQQAQAAYDEGFRQGQDTFIVHIGGYRLTPGVQPGTIWISNTSGEGGDFRLEELATAIDHFFKDRF